MKILDYMYYCIYRYVLKTPDRVAADTWPNLFLGWTLWIHALMAFWVFTLAAEMRVPLSHVQGEMAVVATLIFLMAIFYWYYAWRGNDQRVIQSFEKRGNQARYARLGAIMWYESLLVVFIVGGVLILSQKLTGWPPRP